MEILALIEILAKVARERGNIPVCLGGVDSPLVPVSSGDFVDEGDGKLVLRSGGSPAPEVVDADPEWSRQHPGR